MNNRWPELPFIAWAETAATLQLWTQVIGKIRLSRTPWLNHSWHVTLYVSARGLTTGPIPDGERSFQIDFDFIDHVLWIRTSDGHYRQVMLKSETGKDVSVAKFYGEVMAALHALGIDAAINTMPCELLECTVFEKDVLHRSYDAEAVGRFFRILVSVNDVLARFRTGFIGKASPVHFFWGFVRSGGDAVFRPHRAEAPRRRSAPAEQSRAGGLLARSLECRLLARLAGAGELSGVLSYAYPAPPGFAEAKVKPDKAFYSKILGEFILPYDAVRLADDPDAALMDFLQSTYDAAADLGKWDRKALECDVGRVGKARAI